MDDQLLIGNSQISPSMANIQNVNTFQENAQNLKDYRNDSFPSISFNNMPLELTDTSTSKHAKITKHKSYNHNRQDDNLMMKDNKHVRFNKSARNDDKEDTEKTTSEKMKIMFLERKNRDNLPSYQDSTKMISRQYDMPRTIKKASNITISSNLLFNPNSLPKKESFQTNTERKCLKKTKKVMKKLEIHNYYSYSNNDIEKTPTSPFMLNFESFNNSTVKQKNIETPKTEKMSNLIGKRGEINVNNQKDIYQVQSYESKSKDIQSRISSFKKGKMSEISKLKDLQNQSDFDSMNPLNIQQSVNSNFISFQANNSVDDFLNEPQNIRKKKKVRHSVGISEQRNAKKDPEFSKKSSYRMKLPNIGVIPGRVKSDKKDPSSQNFSSLNDMSSSIKQRVNSNTLSSNSNKNVSSLNDIEKVKVLQTDKNEQKKEISKKELPLIFESEDCIKKQN